MLKKIFKISLAAIVSLFVLLVIVLYIASRTIPFYNNPKLGMNFNRAYAQYLGVDWQEAYLAILNDLKAPAVRLSAPWDELEAKEGVYDFSTLDWQIERAKEKNVEVILAIGRKLPRWPECHDPDWLKGLDEKTAQEKLLKLMKTIVERYKNDENITIWQVENEPFAFWFGICPPVDRNFIEQEVNLVHSLDSRPVMMTESGELSTWIAAARRADVLGISLYRIVWNKLIGYFHYHLPIIHYRGKAGLLSPWVKDFIITELQTEPWSQGDIRKMSSKEAIKAMSPEDIKQSVAYVKKVGFREVYLWGAEWWYYKKVNGDSIYWDVAKEIFAE